jgi:hypothetical protein
LLPPSAVIVVLVLGTLVSTWQAFEARTGQRCGETGASTAERGELDAQQKAYASDMKLAQQELAQNNLGFAPGAVESASA